MIPEFMKEFDQWLVWDTLHGTKMPFAPWTGSTNPVDPLNPEVWGSYELAVKYYRQRGYRGLGFVFTSEDPLVGVDLDDVVKDTVLGENMCSVDLVEPAATIARGLDSFTELSQSGTGLHVYVKGEVGGQCVEKDVELEIYDQGRFFCMTGNAISDYSFEINERQEEIDNVISAYAGGDVTRSTDSDGSGSSYSTGSFNPDDFVPESDDDFDSLRVRDIFDSINPPCKKSHPIHGSSTEANFAVPENDYVCTCFRADCSLKNNPGTVLRPQHLIAMEMNGWMSCKKVRQEWDFDLRVESWKYAVENHGVNPTEIPRSIEIGVASRLGLRDKLFAGGSTSSAVSNIIKRKLVRDYEVGWLS